MTTEVSATRMSRPFVVVSRLQSWAMMMKTPRAVQKTIPRNPYFTAASSAAKSPAIPPRRRRRAPTLGGAEYNPPNHPDDREDDQDRRISHQLRLAACHWSHLLDTRWKRDIPHRPLDLDTCAAPLQTELFKLVADRLHQ